MSTIFALFIGVFSTVMVWFNSRLSEAVGYSTALLFIHLSGLAAVSFLRFFTRTRWKLCPEYPFLHLGGFLGVFAVLFQVRSFNNMGASLTFSAILAGQMLVSFAADSFGLFGSKKRAPSLKKIIPIIITICGLFLILWG